MFTSNYSNFSFISFWLICLLVSFIKLNNINICIILLERDIHKIFINNEKKASLLYLSICLYATKKKRNQVRQMLYPSTNRITIYDFKYSLLIETFRECIVKWLQCANRKNIYSKLNDVIICPVKLEREQKRLLSWSLWRKKQCL
jgi:hypothetical protein